MSILLQGNFTPEDVIQLTLHANNTRVVEKVLANATNIVLTDKDDISERNPLYMVVLAWEPLPAFFNLTYDALLQFATGIPGYPSFPISIYPPEKYFALPNAMTEDRLHELFVDFEMLDIEYVLVVDVPKRYVPIPQTVLETLLEENETASDFTLALFRLVYQNFDDIEQILDFPATNEKTGRWITEQLAERYGTSNSLIWLNKGFSSLNHEYVPDWYVEPAPYQLKEKVV